MELVAKKCVRRAPTARDLARLLKCLGRVYGLRRVSVEEVKAMSWLKFVEVEPPPSGKLRVWSVRSKRDDSELGRVAWHGPWRRYWFYPGNALFEEDCLRDLASFCELRTSEYKARLRLERQAVKPAGGDGAGAA